MIKFLHNLYEIWGRVMAYGLHLYYRKWCIGIMKQQHISNVSVAGKEEYVRKWKPLGKADRRYFRIFSRYIGNTPYIVPEDISHNIVEHLLNPSSMRPYYQDKNMFDKIFPTNFMPRTLLRKIQGSYYDADYRFIPSLSNDSLLHYLGDKKVVFIKPSVETGSGKGIYSFKKNQDNTYASQDGKHILSTKFLAYDTFGNENFIIQEALSQSDYISQFNPSSINTIRIATYRSVKTNEVAILAIVMRIGGRGSHIDNAHAGGVFIGIHQDGTLGKFAADQFGNRYLTFNDCDFEHNTYQIPGFDKVLAFAREVGHHVIHHRLLAQDIALTEDETPRLVEFNSAAFSSWLFQFTLDPAYGNYADEIIEYCQQNKQNIRRVKVSVW